MIKYKGDTCTIDNLTDALELLARHRVLVSITNKAKKDPYGLRLRQAFFKGEKNEAK